MQDFEWSPAEPILCAYQAEQSGGNLPARISLVRIPDRKELRQKNLFSVSGESYQMHMCQLAVPGTQNYKLHLVQYQWAIMVGLVRQCLQLKSWPSLHDRQKC